MKTDRRFQRQRDQLVEVIQEKGITDPDVLAAVGRVPRHIFLDNAFLHRAYEDVALPIGHHVTISQPFTVAYQTSLLGVKPGHRILEVGTGSGYQAAILCEMGAQVFTIERIKPLQARTARLLRSLGYRAVCRFGDGVQGWPSMGPFDGIVVTAGAETIPEDLLRQLRLPDPDIMRAGGRLIIPVGPRSHQRMMRFTRSGENSWDDEELDDFRFVPLLGDTE
ncbi:MAG: protein-L-isoaspartate O-methyltransferase [Bacteroidetes bacterium CG12_big_fil_rev_8_21_14_0_65_60_17]|nr:MAG: protein-L-isoaspartate O-methyltransferase [Bacteroidetes bacterium CG12_big_fil_rev_8_21_14_0_65_60_17]